MRVPEIIADLSFLRAAAGAPRVSAEELLRALLEKWGARFEIVRAATRDRDAYFDPRLEELVKEWEEKVPPDYLWDWEGGGIPDYYCDPQGRALQEYAIMRGAAAIVTLYDGAVAVTALVFKGGG